ncbi:MAG: amidohydrolase family protein [Pigmentiphaga sp.]|nr:amidohydrolase family protein [Pigmentiphaga sp.]
MRHADLIIEAGHVATVDPALGRIQDGAVAVRGGLIADIDTRTAIHQRWRAPAVRREATALMVPGLIDAHVHPGLFFLARLAPPATPGQPGLLARGGQIERFLNLLNQGLKLDPELTLHAARASFLRSLETGVTYFNDAAAGDTDALAAAAAQIGLKGIVTYDFGADLGFDLAAGPPRPIRIAGVDRILARAEAIVARHNGKQGLQCWYNLLCDLSTSDELYRATTALALRDGVGINTHTATVRRHETASRRDFGRGSVRRLLDLGVIGPHWLAAHMGFMARADITELAARGGHVAHCPATSMGAGKGIIAAKTIPALRRAGVNVALGTDSAQWADLPRQMSLAFYAHKEVWADDSVLTPDEVLYMATLAGARACAQAEQRGSISIGKVADLVLVHTDDLAFVPFDDPLLAWLRSGVGALDVYVEGRLRVSRGRAIDLDREAIGRQAQEAAGRFLRQNA